MADLSFFMLLCPIVPVQERICRSVFLSKREARLSISQPHTVRLNGGERSAAADSALLVSKLQLAACPHQEAIQSLVSVGCAPLNASNAALFDAEVRDA